MHDSSWNHTEAATALLDGEFASRHALKQKRTLRWGLFASCLFNVVLLAAFLYPTSKTYQLSTSTNIYSPAHNAIRYKTKTFFSDFAKGPSEYQGWPDDNQDALWEALHSKGRTVQISSEENNLLYNQSIHVPVTGLEDKHMIGLDVFHQLHCLDMIRKSFYPRRYNITLLKQDGTVNYVPWLHVDHCIESIRQSLICNADVTPMHYEWSDEIKSVVPKITVTHTCRDFEEIQKWTADRWVDWKWSDNRKVVENGKVKDYSDWKVVTQEHPLPKSWTDNNRLNEFVH